MKDKFHLILNIFNERKDRKNHLYRKSKNLKIELKVITISVIKIPITIMTEILKKQEEW